MGGTYEAKIPISIRYKSGLPSTSKLIPEPEVRNAQSLKNQKVSQLVMNDKGRSSGAGTLKIGKIIESKYLADKGTVTVEWEDSEKEKDEVKLSDLTALDM